VAAVTRLKKRLGGFLLEMRQRVDLKSEDAAAELKIARPTLTRYENGEVLPAWGSVRTLLTFYGATAEDAARASQFYDDAKDEPPSVRLTAGASKAFRKLVNAEREALRERALAPYVVPGLLQTKRYAQSLVEAGSPLHNPDLRPDSVVATRMERKKPLEGPDPMEVHALVDEAVIRREVGGRTVLREQLEHLLTMAERPNITLQVIPDAVGAYGTMNGSFTIVDYPELGTMPGVYLEYPAGGAWVDNPKDVKRFTATFDQVARLALTPADTINLIGDRLRLLEGHGQNGA
jgi:transcriptional regulator with XRE-family HTH domain